MFLILLVTTFLLSAASTSFRGVDNDSDAHESRNCDATCATCSNLFPITAQKCSTTNSKQLGWEIVDGTTIRSKSNPNHCVTWNMTRGILQFQECDATNPCQQWTIDAKTGYIHGHEKCVFDGSGESCLDIRKKVGPSVQLTRCYNQPNDSFKFSDAGRWTVGDGSSTYPELCLQADETVCSSASCCVTCPSGRTWSALSGGDAEKGTGAGFCDLPKLEKKRSNLFLATPTNSTYIKETLIPQLRQHRDSFTGIIAQGLAICGSYQGNRDGYCGEPNGNISLSDVGPPHFALNHPIASVTKTLPNLLRAELGEDLEVFQIISYGNPGQPDLLNKLTDSKALTDQFIQDAIEYAHEVGLTGINFDIEINGATGIPKFTKAFANALHNANPPLMCTYDSFARKEGVANMDRWISMNTYVNDEKAFSSNAKIGFNDANDKFAAGLCPSCYPKDSKLNVDGIFHSLRTQFGKIREIDLWSTWGSSHATYGFQYYWKNMREWLHDDGAASTTAES
eukprot:g2249.t1